MTYQLQLAYYWGHLNLSCWLNPFLIPKINLAPSTKTTQEILTTRGEHSAQ